MNYFESLSLVIIYISGTFCVMWGIAWLIERTYKKIQILAGLIEFLIYRKQFHEWRKSDPELTPSGDRPAH